LRDSRTAIVALDFADAADDTSAPQTRGAVFLQ